MQVVYSYPFEKFSTIKEKSNQRLLLYIFKIIRGVTVVKIFLQTRKNIDDKTKKFSLLSGPNVIIQIKNLTEIDWN